MLKFNFVSSSKLLCKRNIFLELTRTISNKPVPLDTKDDYDKQLKDFERLSNISRKQRTKKPQKPPFVKNILVGEFDTDILTYPEMEKQDVENIQKDADTLKKVMNHKHMLNCKSMSDKIFRQNLSDYKAIGLQASQLMDGRETNVTESMRLLESLSDHHLRYNIVANEQLGVNTIVQFANDKLKNKYLTQLMKGESLSALCLLETRSLDFSKFSTKATLTPDGKTIVLNGTKSWVINGSSADIFIVFALSNVTHREGQKEMKFTAMVVEKDFPGISVEINEDCDVENANVTFTDVQVPIENVIGEVHEAYSMLVPIITEYRLSAAPIAITLGRNMLNYVTETIIDRSDNENLLHKQDAIREKIGEIATAVYAMESVTYLTSGLMDTYENQDCEVESGIAKLLCSEYASRIATTAIDLIGAPAMSRSNLIRTYHDQIVQSSILVDTNDSLKVILALLGMQHAGNALNEKIHKLRNPLHFSSYALKRMWTQRKNVSDNPPLDLRLADYLHPSLGNASLHLEYCVKRIAFMTEILLTRFGPEIVNYHMQLRRLADCMIDIYAMTAVLGRASRSYCIGLQFGDHEVVLATSFCNYAMERVKKNATRIYDGRYLTNDENYRVVSKRIFQSKEYFAKHPLLRNF